eukprot:13824752-Ditylum_brightwellii.AAC.1
MEVLHASHKLLDPDTNKFKLSRKAVCEFRGAEVLNERGRVVRDFFNQAMALRGYGGRLVPSVQNRQGA